MEPVICAGVPVYRTEHPAHTASMAATKARLGERFGGYVHKGDTLTRARATLYGAFRKRERPWTHYLQTDDDQAWDPAVLEHLARLDLPVVGLPCAYKYDPPHPYAGFSTVRGLAGETARADGTMKVKYLGGGFILWRADVLAALEAAHPELRFRTNNGTADRELTWMLWGGGIVRDAANPDGEYLTEDYWACHLAAELGYEIRCYLPACSPHWSGAQVYVPRGYVRQPPEKAAA